MSDNLRSARDWIEQHLQPTSWDVGGDVDEAKFRCPFHGADNTPSATVNALKRGWACHRCSDGGTLTDLASRLGVEPPAWESESTRRRSGGLGEVVATYSYLDAAGDEVFQVARFEPKAFRPRHWGFDSKKGKNDWIWKQPAAGRGLLYRLPELFKAISDRKPVAVVEGEKDADRLAKLGIRGATTCNGGSEKWTRRHTALMPRGTEVVLFPDADQPGVRHAAKVGRQLVLAGCKVRVVDPLAAFSFEVVAEHGKDVSDWLDAGHDADELLSVIASAVPFDGWPPASLPEVQQQPKESRSSSVAGYDLSPGSLAQRIIKRFSHDLLVVDNEDFGTGYALDHRTGIWRFGGSWWVDWIMTLTTEILAEIAASGLEGRPLKDAVAQVQRLKRPQLIEDIRKELLGVLRNIKRQGDRSDVVFCRRSDLDIKTRYMGAANGIIDLHTGELLDPVEGRKSLTTVYTPVKYNPEAVDPFVGKLFEHLEPEDVAWCWRVLGFHLLGNPSRRVYALVGAFGGGKTTLVNAVMAALGPYASNPHASALSAKTGNNNAGLSPELASFVAPHRLAFIEELPTRISIDVDLFKRITGDGFLTFRLMRENFQTLPATATPIMCCNPESVPRLRLYDRAMADRLRELTYPQVPPDKIDPTFKERVNTDSFKQAFLARIVAAAANETPRIPPEESPNVTRSTAARVDEDVGELGNFAKRVRRGSGNLKVSELWEAWCGHNEDGFDVKESGGISKRRLSTVLRHYVHNLPEPIRFRIGGELARAWRGWVIEEPDAGWSTDDDADALEQAAADTLELPGDW